MKTNDHSMAAPTHPNVSELFHQYLQCQLGGQKADLSSSAEQQEVLPYDAGPVQLVDPLLAWREATAVLAHFHAEDKSAAVAPPPDWQTLVTAYEPTLAMPFCVGNFPQMMRTFQSLLHGTDLTHLRPSIARSIPAPGLLEWAAQTINKKRYPDVLFALGSLRVAKHLDRAAEVLQTCRSRVPAKWQPALANEEAALAWHSGKASDALALWQCQTENVPVHFNRGMAALFLGQARLAHASLSLAVDQLPEESAWHHLGRLYLAVAEMQG